METSRLIFLLYNGVALPIIFLLQTFTIILYVVLPEGIIVVVKQPSHFHDFIMKKLSVKLLNQTNLLSL